MVTRPVQAMFCEPRSGAAVLRTAVGQLSPPLRFFGARRPSGTARAGAGPQRRERGELLRCHHRGDAERAFTEPYAVRTLPAVSHLTAAPNLRGPRSGCTRGRHSSALACRSTAVCWIHRGDRFLTHQTPARLG